MQALSYAAAALGYVSVRAQMPSRPIAPMFRSTQIKCEDRGSARAVLRTFLHLVAGAPGPVSAHFPEHPFHDNAVYTRGDT